MYCVPDREQVKYIVTLETLKYFELIFVLCDNYSNKKCNSVTFFLQTDTILFPPINSKLALSVTKLNETCAVQFNYLPILINTC
mmetsp:Transcript_18625/g.22754  ORF Transcript_18625/g.22754 Transcript_18625/m.22754 type:complete len:84 (-) Transcript_18625:30-281(-)